MPYAGETIRISSVITDYDGVAITDDEIVLVTLSIYRTSAATASLVANEVQLVYDAALGYWWFDWDSTSETAGSYRTKVTVNGAGYLSWSWGRLRLTNNPI